MSAGSIDGNALPAPGRPSDEAFADLIDALRAPLMAHRYRMLGSAHDAEDALQEALLRAWRALSSFDRRQPFRPWLYRIATNVCLDAIARRPRHGLPVATAPRPAPTNQPARPSSTPSGSNRSPAGSWWRRSTRTARRPL